MKTYCKHLIVSDENKIFDCITEYMHDKYRKKSAIRFFSKYMNESREYTRENFRPGTKFWRDSFTRLSKDMATHIRNRSMKEHIDAYGYGQPLIWYKKIRDKGSGKERILGLETLLFRLYEVIARDATIPLFRAKTGIYQCSSIPGRGQNYGKKAILKWISGDVEGTKYFSKKDIKKCYPSIKHSKVLKLLHRDLRKSEELLYMYDTFFELYEEYPSQEAIAPKTGILIGSPVSKDICNYFLSYAYHYASEQLAKVKCRRGQAKRKRLISHVIFYADDIVMYSSNKKDLKTAVDMLKKYMLDCLGVKIKPDWIIAKTMFEDAKGNRKGVMLDYMGFRFHAGKVYTKYYAKTRKKFRKTWVTIRRHTFLTARRKLSLLSKLIKKHIEVTKKFAMSITSSFGWFKNTNMFRYRKRKCVDGLVKVARKIVSDYAKHKKYNEKKYYKMWRQCYVLCCK